LTRPHPLFHPASSPLCAASCAPRQLVSRASQLRFENWCWKSCPSTTASRWLTCRRAGARRAQPTPCTNPLARRFSERTRRQTRAACLTAVPLGIQCRGVLVARLERESGCHARFHWPHGLRWRRQDGLSSSCCASSPLGAACWTDLAVERRPCSTSNCGRSMLRLLLLRFHFRHLPVCVFGRRATCPLR